MSGSWLYTMLLPLALFNYSIPSLLVTFWLWNLSILILMICFPVRGKLAVAALNWLLLLKWDVIDICYRTSQRDKIRGNALALRNQASCRWVGEHHSTLMCSKSQSTRNMYLPLSPGQPSGKRGGERMSEWWIDRVEVEKSQGLRNGQEMDWMWVRDRRSRD